MSASLRVAMHGRNWTVREREAPVTLGTREL